MEAEVHLATPLLATDGGRLDLRTRGVRSHRRLTALLTTHTDYFASYLSSMSLNDIKHPNIRETEHKLTAEQQTALDEVRTLLTSKYDHLTDTTLIRFLTAKSYNAATAHSAIIKYLQWRADKKLDTVLQQPPHNIEVISRIAPHAYHGYDNDNHPLYIERTGAFHCAAIADESILPSEDFYDSHVWGIENLMRLAHEKSLEIGHRIDDFTSIIDMEGVGFQHRVLLGHLKGCMALDDEYYPSRIGKVYIINTGWIAPYAYSFAYPLLLADIQQRINVVKDEPKLILPTVIPPQYCPKQYGGDCECKGAGKPCVPVDDAAEIISRVKAENDGLDRIHVSSFFDKTLECSAEGGTFTWFFLCEDNYDIDFSVQIVLASQPPSAPPIIAHAQQRHITHRGSYSVREKATAVFKWDNSFSYFTGKDVRYAVSVAEFSEKYKDTLEKPITQETATTNAKHS